MARIARDPAARADLVARTQSSLEDAHAAARAAFAGYAAAAPRNADGHLAEPFGRSGVIVYKLSPALRAVLREMDEIRQIHGGAWSVSSFAADASEHGIRALDATCEAACKVLVERLGNEGEFHVQTFLD